MPRILFVAMHRLDRSPAQRFRWEQYLGYLSEQGFTCDVSYLISAEDDRVLYAPGAYVGKLKIFVKSALRRLRDVAGASRYDIVFVQREAFMTGTTVFEKAFARSRAKVVFDYDDAVWVDAVSEGNRLLARLKDASKTARIIGMCDMVFAGNEFLAEYARRHNDNVQIVPTTIDTDEYQRVEREGGEDAARPVCIGWSGSFSTIEYFDYAVSALKRVQARFGDRVRFKVIGDGQYRHDGLGIVGLPWRKDTELTDLSDIDIGIMPLPDDEWTRGKCGLKGLQYMALEIATVMSPVGVNVEIIQDGENGMLASSEDEWVDRLSMLVEDRALRERLGVAGRKTVVEHYSVDSQKDRYVSLLGSLVVK